MLSEPGLFVVIEPALEDEVLSGGVGIAAKEGLIGLEKAELSEGETE